MAHGRDDQENRKPAFERRPEKPGPTTEPIPRLPVDEDEEATIGREVPGDDSSLPTMTRQAATASNPSSSGEHEQSKVSRGATEFDAALIGSINPVPGEVLFGRYLVVEKLGEGGMGSVWLVKHREFESERALKLIVSGIAMDEQSRKRFRREARIMDKLNHPSAVRVYDARIGQDAAFIEMEYVRGESLNKIIKAGTPMPLADVDNLLEQLCGVLQAANDEGIIHRDLKPSNLMFVEGRAGKKTLKLLDFGIAKIRDTGEGDPDDVRTKTGVFIGTPHYSSPEQIRGDRLDARSDIYSTGVLLYELITGYRPFTGSLNALIANHSFTTPPSFAEKNKEIRIPAEVEAVVMACLAKDPKDRPQSPRELYERFKEALEVSHALENERGLMPTERGKTRTRGLFKSSGGAKTKTAKITGQKTKFGDAYLKTLHDAEVEEGRRGPWKVLLMLLALVTLTTATVLAALFFLVPDFASRLRNGGAIKEVNKETPKKQETPKIDSANPDIAVQVKLWSKRGFDAGPDYSPEKGWPNQLIDRATKIRFVRTKEGFYLPPDYTADKELDATDKMPVALIRKDGVKFARIHGGTFMMGNADPFIPNGKPPHSVTLSSFYMQTTEVTNGEIEKSMGTTIEQACPQCQWRSKFNDLASKLTPNEASKHPAVGVSYKIASDYAKKMGGMLPTEAQWEYAARSQGQDFKYVWDFTKDRDVSPTSVTNLNSFGSNEIETSAVGKYPADRTMQGIFDLTSNVREICRDRYLPYKSEAEVDPEFPPNSSDDGEATTIVLRGGSFATPEDEGTTTFRVPPATALSSTTDSNPTVGFRIVIQCPDVPLFAHAHP